ncbi:metal ABC transporter substrate-binding protein [Treponema sp. UBA3813]|uniref:metal ABC transporter substrate-binding protein n=1 Tax=Treponema sp. UBA3813 TaxID=1947715 RepID=UPI0025D044FB|nr:metal ABC transporter substrate-binding protein [Treponema sp. UBA3813]
MKKLLAFAGILLALGMGSAFAKKASNENKVKVVTTIFPEYDWVKEIVGEKADDVDLTLLLNNGVDLHSYQPSVKDIAKIQDADIFVYVGGESDEWVDDVLKNVKSPNQKVINLLEVLGDRVKAEEIVEGMEHEHHHDDDEHEHGHEHDGDHHDEHDHDDEEELDEHVWLSLKNAQILTSAICDALCQANSKNADIYKKNFVSYNKKLADLDAKYEAAVKAASKNTLLFGDRFPFRYLVDDYGLKYYAAFSGCSAESEASFKTIVFLSEKVNELDLQRVCQIESGNGKIAKTVISNSKNKKAKVLIFDSLQSTTAKQIKKGATYLGAMEKNLEVLKEALR